MERIHTPSGARRRLPLATWASLVVVALVLLFLFYRTSESDGDRQEHEKASTRNAGEQPDAGGEIGEVKGPVAWQEKAAVKVSNDAGSDYEEKLKAFSLEAKALERRRIKILGRFTKPDGTIVVYGLLKRPTNQEMREFSDLLRDHLGGPMDTPGRARDDREDFYNIFTRYQKEYRVIWMEKWASNNMSCSEHYIEDPSVVEVRVDGVNFNQIDKSPRRARNPYFEGKHRFDYLFEISEKVGEGRK